MELLPQKAPGIPPAESQDGVGISTLPAAKKALDDALYLISETSKEYSQALGYVRRLPAAEKEALQAAGVDFDKLLDSQADLLSATKLVSRQLKAFERVVPGGAK